MLPPTNERLEEYLATCIIPQEAKELKPLRFAGSSRDDLRAFPEGPRQDAGYELDQIQRGRMPSDFRPLLAVGRGANEIRIHRGGEWRVIYVAKLKDAVHVLHAFRKETQRTPKEDIQIAAQRYRAIEESST